MTGKPDSVFDVVFSTLLVDGSAGRHARKTVANSLCWDLAAACYETLHRKRRCRLGIFNRYSPPCACIGNLRALFPEAVMAGEQQKVPRRPGKLSLKI
jgi:hypothetical protein